MKSNFKLLEAMAKQKRAWGSYRLTEEAGAIVLHVGETYVATITPDNNVVIEYEAWDRWARFVERHVNGRAEARLYEKLVQLAKQRMPADLSDYYIQHKAKVVEVYDIKFGGFIGLNALLEHVLIASVDAYSNVQAVDEEAFAAFLDTLAVSPPADFFSEYVEKL